MVGLVGRKRDGQAVAVAEKNLDRLRRVLEMVPETTGDQTKAVEMPSGIAAVDMDSARVGGMTEVVVGTLSHRDM